jgi:hypothetical protein
MKMWATQGHNYTQTHFNPTTRITTNIFKQWDTNSLTITVAHFRPNFFGKLHFFWTLALRPNAGHDHLFIEVYRSHTHSVDRTPLDEWSARHGDLYLTTQNTHNRQTSMAEAGIEPAFSAGEWPLKYALDSAKFIYTALSNVQHFCRLCASKLFILLPVSVLTL